MSIHYEAKMKIGRHSLRKMILREIKILSKYSSLIHCKTMIKEINSASDKKSLK